MTTESQTSTTIPKPRIVRTQLTSQFWRAASQGVLLLQRCGACGHLQHYARPICTSCWSTDVSWQPARGTGTVWTFTVVGMPGHPAWQTDVPYVLAIVELDEGPRVMTNIINCLPEDVEIGDHVALSPSFQSDSGQTILTFSRVDPDV